MKLVVGAVIAFLVVFAGLITYMNVIKPEPDQPVPPAPPQNTQNTIQISGESYQSLAICYSDNTCETRKSERAVFSFLFPQASVDAVLNNKGKQITSITASEFIKLQQGVSLPTKTNYQMIVADAKNFNHNVTIGKESTRTLNTVAGLEYLTAQETFTAQEILAQAKTLNANSVNVLIKYNTYFSNTKYLTTGFAMLQNLTRTTITQEAQAPAPAGTETILQGNIINFSPPQGMSELYISKIDIRPDKSVYVEVYWTKGSTRITINTDEGQETITLGSLAIVIYISPEFCSLLGTQNWNHDGGFQSRPLICDRSFIAKFPAGSYVARLRAIDVGDIQSVSFQVPP